MGLTLFREGILMELMNGTLENDVTELLVAVSSG